MKYKIGNKTKLNLLKIDLVMILDMHYKIIKSKKN